MIGSLWFSTFLFISFSIVQSQHLIVVLCGKRNRGEMGKWGSF